MDTQPVNLNPGDLVTINARTLNGRGRGHGKGRLVELHRDTAIVKPFGGHGGKLERVPVKYVKPWRSGLRRFGDGVGER